MPLLKEGLVTAERLVDVTGVLPRGISGGTIGAGSTLAELEADPQIPAALRESCRLAASPQLRNMGTIGGNLLQATRCWYWRLDFPCYLHGGDRCHAKAGQHREHAFFGNERCASAHPSDPAAALLALGATIRTDRREFPIADLYRLPSRDDRSTTTLQPGELILELDVPEVESSVYLKAMDRKRWSFALVGVAAARVGGGRGLRFRAQRPSRGCSSLSTPQRRCRAPRTRSTSPGRSSTGRSRPCDHATIPVAHAAVVPVLVTIVAALLAGCGGDDGDAGGTAAAETTVDGECHEVEAPEPRADGGEQPPNEALDSGQDLLTRVQTNCGSFTIELDPKTAPKTAASLVSLAESGFYDGTTFHRVVPGFVIQGGDPTGTGSGGPGYKTVDVPPSDAAYTKGVVAMAKAENEAPGTSGSQFFVVTGAGHRPAGRVRRRRQGHGRDGDRRRDRSARHR